MAESTARTESTAGNFSPTSFSQFFQLAGDEYKKKENEVSKLKKKLDSKTQDLASSDERNAELERKLLDLNKTIERLDKELLQARVAIEQRSIIEVARQDFLSYLDAGYAKYYQTLSKSQIVGNKSMLTFLESNCTTSPSSSGSSSPPNLPPNQVQELQSNSTKSQPTESRSEMHTTIGPVPNKGIDASHTSKHPCQQSNETRNTDRSENRSQVISEPSNGGDGVAFCRTDDSEDMSLSPPRKRPRTGSMESSHCNNIVVGRPSEENPAKISQETSSIKAPEQVTPTAISVGVPPEARPPVAQMLPQTARDALSQLRVQIYEPVSAEVSARSLSQTESFPIAIEWDQKLSKTTIPLTLGYALQQEVKKLVALADTGGVKFGSPHWRDSFFGAKPLSSCLWSRIIGRHSPDYVPPLPGTQTYPTPRPSNPNATRRSRLALSVACRHCFEDKRPCVNSTGERVVVLPLHESLRVNYQRHQLQYWIKSD